MRPIPSSELYAIVRRRIPIAENRQRIRTDSCAFVTHCRFDAHKLEGLLRSIRHAYPAAPVAVIADGDDDPAIVQVCRAYGAQAIIDQRLKIPGQAHRFIERYLRTLIEFGTEFGIKVDPDTRINRRFEYFLDSDLAGTVLGMTRSTKHIQGGCIAFSKQALKKIINAGVLKTEKYSRIENWCRNPRLKKSLERYEQQYQQANTDFPLHAIVKELALSISDWHEILSLWHLAATRSQRFAAVHPVQDADFSSDSEDKSPEHASHR